MFVTLMHTLSHTERVSVCVPEHVHNPVDITRRHCTFLLKGKMFVSFFNLFIVIKRAYFLKDFIVTVRLIYCHF